jgi:hypothetical protein
MGAPSTRVRRAVRGRHAGSLRAGDGKPTGEDVRFIILHAFRPPTHEMGGLP